MPNNKEIEKRNDERLKKEGRVLVKIFKDLPYFEYTYNYGIPKDINKEQ